jgi:hypothetical protein
MSDQPETADRLQIRFIKSAFFRVMCADGAIAGITPSGGIHVEFYNTRAAMPDRVTHVLDKGMLGDEIESERIATGGLVREVEGQIVMNRETAEALITILRSQLDTLKAVKQAKTEAKDA